MINYTFDKINIFSGEEVDSWILGKFAKILEKQYSDFGIKTTISRSVNHNEDCFNHCLIYLHCNPETASNKDVLMITHIDAYWKYQLLEQLLPKVALGICMSKDQMDKLINMGLDKNKLCYVNPAHDGIIPVKKYVVGLASRVYSDGRKNENYFCKLADILDCKYFKFKIMGAHWEPQVEYMRSKGFEVEYDNDFNYEKYTQYFFADMDYYLYMGLDEGQMGFVDAQSAGVKTIVTAQGYHLDSDSPITHAFMTYEELEKIFVDLQNEKMSIVEAMHDWTWENYAIKHLHIFEYLSSGKIIDNNFKDGINSLINNINSPATIIDEKAKTDYIKYLKREIIHKDVAYVKNSKSLSFLEKIFSVRNCIENGKKRKIITILGIKIKLLKKNG